MEFGIFSNGIRPHTTAAASYAEDIREIVLADKLGYSVVYISEHHGEQPYINRVDTIPAPELMMCKAAALTKQIRMGAAVKLIHLHHPMDVAVQAAVTDHMVGGGRFIFGFGSGFPLKLFCEERGLGFDDRHDRLAESLDFILKAWAEDEPFDWDGEHWQAKGAVVLPKPLNRPHMPMATATETEATIRMAGERGYTLLSAFFDSAEILKKKADLYAEAAAAAGQTDGKRGVATSRLVYISDSRETAIEELRPWVAFETTVQAERGFLHMLEKVYGLTIEPGDTAIDALLEAGMYIVGTPDDVGQELKDFYDASGGFGTLMIVAGKDWATPEKRDRSMRLFMEEVAPGLRNLDPVAEHEAAA